ncbi:hypothetical protein BPOR_0308g00110 [Botrytis porri]|uniref:Uncharacterized protein n=1 Tax=Botrytis porri TaxID=87229 RepID=A0A4Z1KJZ8_9HELO|nr:hypothetical protein BPOR_0308g00110 [Botrytis porri]
MWLAYSGLTPIELMVSPKYKPQKVPSSAGFVGPRKVFFDVSDKGTLNLPPVNVFDRDIAEPKPLIKAQKLRSIGK